MVRLLLFCTFLIALALQGRSAPAPAIKLQLGKGTPVSVWRQGEMAEIRISGGSADAAPPRHDVDLSLRDFDDNEVWSFRGKAEDLPLDLPEPKRFGPYTLSGTIPGNGGKTESFQRHLAYVPRAASGDHGSMQYGIVLLNLPIPLVKPGALACRLAGADFIRSSMSWKEAEAAPGRWDWSYYDDYFGALRSRGLRWVPILWHAPPWGLDKTHRSTLKPESGVCRMPFPDRRLWADFILRALERYGKELRTVEVWNEPDLPYFADFTPEEYAELLKDVRRAIEAKHLPIRITTCGFTCLPGQHPKMIFKDYMPRALKAAAGAYDCHSIHFHGGFTDYKESLNRFIRLRQEWGIAVPWAANETAVSASFCGRKRQAAILFEKMVYSQAKGAEAYVWHNLRDLGKDPKNAEHNYGLMDNDYEPKEAYSAYAATVHLFRGAEPIRDLSRGECICLVFRRGKEILIPVWTFSGKSREREVVFSGIQGKAYFADLYGNRRDLAVRSGTLRLPVSKVPGTLLLEQEEAPELVEVHLAPPQETVIRLAADPKLTGAPCIHLEKRESYHATAPADPSFADCVWRGAGDCSAKLWMGMNGGILRVRAEIRDDVHTPPCTPEVPSGDKVQFFFAPQRGTPLFKFSLVLDREGKAQMQCKESPARKNTDALRRKCRVSITRDDRAHLTNYELRIPAAELGIRQGVPFRFNAVIFDDDGRVQEGYHALVPVSGGPTSGGTGLPQFVFSERKDPQK